MKSWNRKNARFNTKYSKYTMNANLDECQKCISLSFFLNSIFRYQWENFIVKKRQWILKLQNCNRLNTKYTMNASLDECRKCISPSFFLTSIFRYQREISCVWLPRDEPQTMPDFDVNILVKSRNEYCKLLSGIK